MLVEEIKNNVSSGGTVSPSRNKVQVEIVSNAANLRNVTMYQHPIHASLRELGQNAADSHVLAGKADVPFTVTLPTALAPECRVRDYGTGITPQEFEANVIHIGDSSKRGSDNQTGGFGRGLYAILGYTDSFSMRCIKNGVFWVHECTIDEE